MSRKVLNCCAQTFLHTWTRTASQHQAAVFFFSTRIISKVPVKPELFSYLHHFWPAGGGWEGLFCFFEIYWGLNQSGRKKKAKSIFLQHSSDLRCGSVAKGSFWLQRAFAIAFDAGSHFFPTQKKNKEKYFHRENCSHITQLDGGHSVFCNYLIILSREKSWARCMDWLRSPTNSLMCFFFSMCHLWSFSERLSSGVMDLSLHPG